MQLTIQIKTKQKISQLVFIDEYNATAYVKSLPIDGKANNELFKLLSKHYKVPQKSIQLLRGAKSKTKVFEINA